MTKTGMYKWIVYLIWLTSFLGIGCYVFAYPKSTRILCDLAPFHPLATCSSPYGQERIPEAKLYWPLQFSFRHGEKLTVYNLDWAIKNIVGGSHYRQLVFYWSLRRPGIDYNRRLDALFCKPNVIRERFGLEKKPDAIIIRLVSPDPQNKPDIFRRFQCLS